MAARRRLSGFTLIELLISITILGLVIGLATYGFSLFSRHWEVPRSSFEAELGELQRLDLVGRALSDALPWVVKDERGTPGFYFLGREEGLTLVTSSPVFAMRSPAVIRLFREAAGEGRWRLVYEEASLEGVMLQRGSQNLPFSRRLIVLESAPAVQFRFYGWASLTERLAAGDPGVANAPQWWSEFDGLQRIQQPQRVGVSIGGFEAVYEIPERSEILLNRASPMT